MSVEILPEESFVGAPADVDTPTRGWIVSRGFDSALVVAAPLIGLVTMITATRLFNMIILMSALMFLIGIPHYLSTFVFFAGDDQRAYYLSRPMSYIGGPILIVAAVA